MKLSSLVNPCQQESVAQSSAHRNGHSKRVWRTYTVHMHILGIIGIVPVVPLLCIFKYIQARMVVSSYLLVQVSRDSLESPPSQDHPRIVLTRTSHVKVKCIFGIHSTSTIERLPGEECKWC